jgi:hypothetical protein
MPMRDIQRHDTLGPKPVLLNWEEGASLIRSSTNLIAEQLAWSVYFFLSAGIDRGGNIPIGNIDAKYVAKVVMLFSSDDNVLKSIAQGKLRVVEVPPLRRHENLLQVEQGISFAASVSDARARSLLILFFVHLDILLSSIDQPCCPLDLFYLSRAMLHAVTPISYVEDILNGEDFRHL